MMLFILGGFGGRDLQAVTPTNCRGKCRINEPILSGNRGCFLKTSKYAGNDKKNSDYGYFIRSFKMASSKRSFGSLLISSFTSWSVENSFKLIDVAVWMIAFSFASVRLIMYSLIW